MKFFFSKDFSLTDMFTLGVSVQVASINDSFIAGFLVLIVGLVVSILGERALRKRGQPR